MGADSRVKALGFGFFRVLSGYIVADLAYTSDLGGAFFGRCLFTTCGHEVE